MAKCKHKNLDERHTWYGEGFYFCNDCKGILYGWSYHWRKNIWTVLAGIVIFAVIQTIVYNYF